MISALHLVWILPVTAAFGFFIAALLSANGRDKHMLAERKKKEPALKHILESSLHYRFDEESCQMVLDINKTVENMLEMPIEIVVEGE